MTDRINTLNPMKIDKTLVGKTSVQEPKVTGQNFNQILDEAISEAKNLKIPAQKKEVGLEFSKHAMTRLNERNITLDENAILRLESAVDKAAQKGSKESLVITDQAAFIVNVPKKKIITAIDKAQMSENVFTNIDSTVIA